MNLKYEYTEFDLDDLFNIVDVVEDGTISRPELKNFLKKLGNTPPDNVLRRRLGLCEGIPSAEQEAADTGREEVNTERKLMKVES